MRIKNINQNFVNLAGILLLTVVFGSSPADAVLNATPVSNYCVLPPFVAAEVPPQVLFTVGKDHKMYTAAYNDSSDIAGPNGEDALDGILETGYKHAISYYGYFDANKCYDYSSGTFVPYGRTTTKYCEATNCTNAAGTAISCAGKFSGNFLNWAAMSRADIIKMVMYGGYRTSDNNGTNYAELSGEWIPQDAHIWGKEYFGSDAPKLFAGGLADKRALFCVKGASVNGKQIATLNVIPSVDAVVANATANNSLRAWHWINVNGNADICSDSKIDTDNDAVANVNSIPNGTRTTYNVSVRACKADDGFMADDWETKHCKVYGSNGRPVGLMQIYGEKGTGSKVCSKNMYTTCTNNGDCTGNGECVDRALMYFGLMMGSYQNPKAGGYLRKNIWSIMNETNSQGLLQTSDPDNKGLIMKSFEELKAPTSYPLSSHWGNPISEILYETMRYWAGKQTPTAAFIAGVTNGANGDNGYFSSKMDWEKPGNIFPNCSIPFVLVFSDIYNSFDDDHLPGSPFNAAWSNAAGELTDLNVKNLADAIAVNESKANTSAMVGNYGTTSGVNTNNACTAKTITSGFGDVRGLCPGEADQKGTYYAASVALYGHTLLKSKNETNSNAVSNVNTYVVAFNSVIPELTMGIVEGGVTKKATIVPYGRTKGGTCTTANFNFTNDPVAGNDQGTAPTRGLIITPTNTNGTCDHLQTTSVYIMGKPNDNPTAPTDTSSPRYDANGNLTYIKFRWGTDDIGGGDFDIDMLEEYEICSGANTVGCKKYDGTALGLAANQVAVTVRRVYSSAGNRAALGFIISGTGSATDGAYLPVKKVDNLGAPPTGTAGWDTLPYERTIVFTITGGGGELLKDPLWYAAKYGGFNDGDSDNLPYTDATCDPKTRGAATRNPKCNEWVTNADSGDPDNYFLISNPRQTETQLRKALDAILARTASGTAASILSNSEGSGANILQAVFFPKRFYQDKEVNWIGEIHNMWYYVDPFISGSTIREDTVNDHVLNIGQDKVIKFLMDDNKAKFVRLSSDGTSVGPFEPDDPGNGLTTLWSAGKKLWERDITADPRTIYTQLAGTLTSFTGLDTSVATNLDYLQVANATQANNLINFMKGVAVTGFRSRTANINGTDGVWRMGDIISSTPRLQSTFPIQKYHLESARGGYNDTTYKQYIESTAYQNRGMVYAGTNDGLFHAFKLGKLVIFGAGITDTVPGRLEGTNLGREEWAFIPKNALPYLKYLVDPAYKDNHIYLNDLTPQLFDVSFGLAGLCSTTTDPIVAARCGSPLYWDRPKDQASWKTVVISGMGIGGATKIIGDGCVAGNETTGVCVKTPTTDPLDNTKGLGYSSYFALDITGMHYDTAGADAGTLAGRTPSLLWEFDHPELGFATSGPALVRLNSRRVTDSSLNKCQDTELCWDKTSNGRWLVVFASGPTGPIDTTKKQFIAKSNQNLKLFVFDLAEGPTKITKNDNVWVIDTGIAEAFSGSLTSGVDDYERIDYSKNGNYQDDALYLGYVKKASDGKWNDGGVLRVVIPHMMNADNFNPAVAYASTDANLQWRVSRLIDGIGPVTAAVNRIQGSNNLYVIFGTGRYYSKDDDPFDSSKLDSNPTKYRKLFMVKDPCYKETVTHNGIRDDGTAKTFQIKNDIEDSAGAACLTAASAVPTVSVAFGSLDNRTAGTVDTLVASGWYINLDANERSLTDTVVTPNGAFYTTFLPSQDICKFTGDSFFWGVDFGTGYQLPLSAKQGKALIQTSVGVFKEVDLSEAFTDKAGRRSGSQLNMQGKAATDAPSVLTKAGLNPKKKVLHIKER